MAAIPRVVKNLLPDDILLIDITASDLSEIRLPSGVNFDLGSVVTDTELVKSHHLRHLVAIGAIQIITSFDTADLHPEPATADVKSTSPQSYLPLPGLAWTAATGSNATIPGAGVGKKTAYANDLPGFELSVESIEGATPRLLGAAEMGRMWGPFGIGYTMTRYTRAQRESNPTIVAAGFQYIFDATVGQHQGRFATYTSDNSLDGTQQLTSGLQKAFDDMGDGTGSDGVTPGPFGYIGNIRLVAGNHSNAFDFNLGLPIGPGIVLDKSCTIGGLLGSARAPRGTALACQILGRGVPALVINGPTDGVTPGIFVTLHNVRLTGIDAPALVINGNVNVRAVNCSFFSRGGGGRAVIEVNTPALLADQPIHILTDCDVNSGGGLHDLVQYIGAGPTWVTAEGGTWRSNNGHIFHLMPGSGYAPGIGINMSFLNVECFNSNMIIKNDSGNPRTAKITWVNAQPVKTIDGTITVDRSGQL